MFKKANEWLMISRIVSIIFICVFAYVSIDLYFVTNQISLFASISYFSVMCSYGIACYFSRHPHPKEKSFITWLGILKLKLQIAILNKNLKGYPDLKKYRGRPGIKNSVKEWRLELKELKNDLKKLVK